MTLLNSGSLVRVSLGEPLSWPANFLSSLLNRWPVAGPCGCRENCHCLAGGCAIASESQKKRRRMPRSVTSANGSGNGGKRGDQRAETGERRGARFNRIVDLRPTPCTLSSVSNARRSSRSAKPYLITVDALPAISRVPRADRLDSARETGRLVAQSRLGHPSQPWTPTPRHRHPGQVRRSGSRDDSDR